MSGNNKSNNKNSCRCNQKNNKKESSGCNCDEKNKESQVLTDQILKLDAEKKELIDQLQRLQAEFENYKKRTDKSNEQLLEYAKKDLIVSLLPLLDSFEMSMKHIDKVDEFKSGMQVIHKQFVQILEKEGLKAVECVGNKFDHNFNEVMLTEERDCEDDTVLEEFQKGYTLKGVVIRHSKVKVSKKN